MRAGGRVRISGTGGFAFNPTRPYPRTRIFIPQEETEFRSDLIRPARLSLARVSVLQGNGLKEAFRLLTTTSVQVIPSPIVLPSSLTPHVPRFPLPASPRQALGTARSWRPGSALAKAHVHSAES